VFTEFPLVKSHETVNIIVDHPKSYKGTTLIYYYNSDVRKQLSIRAFTFDYECSTLYKSLQKGDSISRKAHSDTLYLYKKNGSIMKFNVNCLE